MSDPRYGPGHKGNYDDTYEHMDAIEAKRFSQDTPIDEQSAARAAEGIYSAPNWHCVEQGAHRPTEDSSFIYLQGEGLM